MNFSLSTHLFVYDPLSLDHLKMIGEAGLSQFELWCMNPHFNFHSWKRVKELHQWLEQTNLSLSSIHAPFYRNFEELRAGFTLEISDKDKERRQIAREEIGAALKVASDLGAPRAVVHAGKREDPDDDVIRSILRLSLDNLLSIAEKCKVAIALENVGSPLSKAAELLKTVTHFSSKFLSVCFDIGHGNMSEDVEKAIRTLGSNLQTTHIHDNHGKSDEHLYPFSGNIDWGKACKAFQDINYGGPWVLEPRKYEDPYTVHFQKLKQAMNQLRQISE